MAVAIVISGAGISSEDADGNQLETVAFDEGTGSVEAFLTDALGVAPTHPSDGSDCMVSAAVTQWGDQDEGIQLRVPSSIDPPMHDAFVITKATSVNGVAIRASAGFSVGDDISAIPETLPAVQTVGLHDSLGFEDPLNFVFDSAGTFGSDGVEYAFGGSVNASKGIAVAIFSPRPSARAYC